MQPVCGPPPPRGEKNRPHSIKREILHRNSMGKYWQVVNKEIIRFSVGLYGYSIGI